MLIYVLYLDSKQEPNHTIIFTEMIWYDNLL